MELLRELIVRCSGMEGNWAHVFYSLPLSHSDGGDDYTSLSMVLTFNSGTSSQMVTVATSNDSVIEDEETFTLALTEDDDAVNMLSPQSVTVTITDITSKYIHCHINRIKEPLPVSSLSILPLSSSGVTVGFDQTVQSVDEGQSAMVTVSVMGENVTLDRNVIVTVLTTDGTAVGADSKM